MSSVFVFHRGSKRRDSGIDYLQKAKKAKNGATESCQLDRGVFVHPDILADMVSQVVTIKADGWCGFRSITHAVYGDQDEYMLVKAKMQERLRVIEGVYREHFGQLMDKEYIDKSMPICQHALDDPAAAIRSCPSEYWFNAPGCVQLAADTCNRPVALYPSTAERTPTDPDSYIIPHLLFLPFDGPTSASNRPLPPIILQQNNNNHWIMLELKQVRLMKWPVIDRGIQLAYQSSGENPRSLRQHLWRHLDIRKNRDD